MRLDLQLAQRSHSRVFYTTIRGVPRLPSADARRPIFEFRWPWLPGETWETTVSVLLERAGYGTLLTLTDGPFDLRVPGVVDAYAETLEGWGEALAWLRGVVDFSSDLRTRPY
jgi:hypothetical protein